MANLNNITTYLSTFGGSPSASPFQNALACQQAVARANAINGGVILFDNPGTYNIDVSESIPFDLANNTIVSGAYASTVLRVNNTGNPVIRISGQYCALKNLLIEASGNPTSGSLVVYEGSLGIMDTVRITGGFVNLEIVSGYELFASNIHLGGINTTPGSVILWVHKSSGSARSSGTIFFTNSNIQADWSGETPGYSNAILIQNSDGLWFTGAHVGFASGAQVLIQPQYTTDGLAGVHFVGCDIDGNGAGTSGIDFEPLSGFTGVQGPFMFSGMYIAVGSGPGVLMNDPTTQRVSFSGVMAANWGPGKQTAPAYQINQGSHISICGGSAVGGVVIGGSAVDVVTSGMTAG